MNVIGSATALAAIMLVIVLFIVGCQTLEPKGRPQGTPTYTPYQIEEMCERQKSEWCE